MRFFDLINDKAVLDIAKVFFPQFRTGKGRPVKKTFADSLGNATTIGKLVLAAAGAQVLVKKGFGTGEHIAAVTAYVMEHLNDIDLVNAFPSSQKWVVREALEKMGFQGGQVPTITWDEVMAQVMAWYSVVQVSGMATQAWGQAQTQGWKPEQYQVWLGQWIIAQQQAQGQKA